jgi:hypothetical protein
VGEHVFQLVDIKITCFVAEFSVAPAQPPQIMSSPPFNVISATASELQDRLKAGMTTSVEITTAYLAQIEKHNSCWSKVECPDWRCTSRSGAEGSREVGS